MVVDMIRQLYLFSYEYICFFDVSPVAEHFVFVFCRRGRSIFIFSRDCLLEFCRLQRFESPVVGKIPLCFKYVLFFYFCIILTFYFTFFVVGCAG